MTNSMPVCSACGFTQNENGSVVPHLAEPGNCRAGHIECVDGEGLRYRQEIPMFRLDATKTFTIEADDTITRTLSIRSTPTASDGSDVPDSVTWSESGGETAGVWEVLDFTVGNIRLTCPDGLYSATTLVSISGSTNANKFGMDSRVDIISVNGARTDLEFSEELQTNSADRAEAFLHLSPTNLAAFGENAGNVSWNAAIRAAGTPTFEQTANISFRLQISYLGKVVCDA